MSSFVHCCLVREGLPHGVRAAQLVHAAGESGPADSGTYALVLAAADEAALLDYESKLIELGVPHAAIREPDSLYHFALMTIGIRPMRKRSIPKFLKKLPLLR